MIEVYIENSVGNVLAYYDEDATLSEIVTDLEKNHLEIADIEHYKKGTVNGFVITVK